MNKRPDFSELRKVNTHQKLPKLFIPALSGTKKYFRSLLNFYVYFRNLFNFYVILMQDLAKLLEDQHGYIDLQNISDSKYYSMDQNPDEEEKL
jgi:hypothetical protein